MLKLENVSAGYGGVDVVKSINLDLEKGQDISIIGPNGCGKSTLLKTMAGLLPYKGEIYLVDKPLRRMKRGEIAKKLAMLSQMPPLFFSYSVYDTVMMGRYMHSKSGLLGTPSSADKAFVEECLQATGLWSEKDRDITKLSGGQLQRVFLARTLAQDPEVILLDEPTNHLDLKYQIELVEYLKTWAKEKAKSIIGVLHDINLAMRLSDQIIVMDEGEIAYHGSPEELMSGPLLEAVYQIDVAGYMRDTLKRWG